MSPENKEAIRLLRKFFPECRSVVSESSGMHWESFSECMSWAVSGYDFSCAFWLNLPKQVADGHYGSFLYEKGRLDGEDSEVIDRLLKHAGFSPQGRALVVPDGFIPPEEQGFGLLKPERAPFVCHVHSLFSRLSERESGLREKKSYTGVPMIFDGGSESLFAFESGEVILVQHDDAVFWAKSKIRRYKG